MPRSTIKNHASENVVGLANWLYEEFICWRNPSSSNIEVMPP
jgi:hypothetical protein